ncbi:MAG TPA: hypothetical protein VHX86_08375 [Tepidisphaeraceae bacterium]|nr:hypothetical protein [Tepidisphaeraceae bacterium]
MGQEWGLDNDTADFDQVTNESAPAAFGQVADDSAIYLDGSNGTLSAGSLLDTGNYTQTGELIVGLGGDQAGEYGVLTVNGTANLGGSLGIVLPLGFDPVPGDSFTIIDAGSISGTFSNVIMPPNMDFSVQYTPNSVILTSLPEPSSLGIACLATIGLVCGGLLRRRDARMVPGTEPERS